MLVAIKLDKNLDCQQLCAKVQQLINYHVKHEPIEPDSFLVLEIQKSYESKIVPLNIEHKDM